MTCPQAKRDHPQTPKMCLMMRGAVPTDEGPSPLLVRLPAMPLLEAASRLSGAPSLSGDEEAACCSSILLGGGLSFPWAASVTGTHDKLPSTLPEAPTSQRSQRDKAGIPHLGGRQTPVISITPISADEGGVARTGTLLDCPEGEAVRLSFNWHHWTGLAVCCCGWSYSSLVPRFGL